MLSEQKLPQATEGDGRNDENGSTSPGHKSTIPKDSAGNDDDQGTKSSPKEDNTVAPPMDDAAPPLPTEEAIPPLPEEAPPLPSETPPAEDDGWEPKWDDRAQAYYFFNRFTNISQWENPRVPTISQPPPPGVIPHASSGDAPGVRPVVRGYDPAIHGDYDPNADYAQIHEEQPQHLPEFAPGTDPAAPYAATGAFNRFTGKWQNTALNPENFNDENKSRRQMNAFFDVDAAANSHDGKSLKAERAGKKLSKQELKAFKEKRKERKEEKRRAWLRD